MMIKIGMMMMVMVIILRMATTKSVAPQKAAKIFRS
jgi:hypothetical protein